MKILIIGANGQIGKQLTTFIQAEANLKARAMIRDEAQAPFFEDHDAEVSIVDLEQDVEAIAKAADGVDAVVFTAGSGGHTGIDKTITIDLDGAVKAIEATERANVKRFIMISSFDTSRQAIQDASTSFAPYVVAKHYADEWLKATDLDYTIIHPGLLTNNEGTNHVNLGPNVDRGEVSREDIARTIVRSLQNDATIGKAFRVVSGATTIDDAIKQLK